jgi:ADP-heptose:LPS heptosyltransferase
MRLVDHWLGRAVCFLLTCWRRLILRPSERLSEEPRHILFIKLAEQGSTVLAVAALQAAVRRVGKKNVYFLLLAENRPILDLLNLIPPENIIEIQAPSLIRALVSAVGAIWRLRHIPIDAALDLEFFACASAALAYLSGARWRIGYHAFGHEASYRGDLMTHRLSFNPYLHTAQAFQLFVEALNHPADRFPTFNIEPPSLRPLKRRFRARPQEIQSMKAILRKSFGQDPNAGLILLNPNASDLMPLRRWPPERYVLVAQRFLERYPAGCVAFTGAPGETELVDELARQVDSRRCISLAGKTTLRQLLVLYELADVLVTNDSGPAHFATLTPIDVIVLFGPEMPRLFSAPGRRTHPLWAGLACSPCINAYNNRRSSCTDNVCMQHISVEQVVDKLDRVFQGRLQFQNGYAIRDPSQQLFISKTDEPGALQPLARCASKGGSSQYQTQSRK